MRARSLRARSLHSICRISFGGQRQSCGPVICLLNGRRQSDQIQEHTANQRHWIGKLGRGQTLSLLCLIQKTINFAGLFGRSSWGNFPGDFRCFRRNKRPVLTPRRPGVHPVDQQLSLFICQAFIRRGRWHPHVRVAGQNPANQFAVISIARFDDEQIVAVLQQSILIIQTQVGFSRLLVRAMTMKTGIAEYRPDIPRKVRALLTKGRRTVRQCESELATQHGNPYRFVRN